MTILLFAQMASPKITNVQKFQKTFSAQQKSVEQKNNDSGYN